MWGDAVNKNPTALAGFDTFVFGVHSGQDNFIMDFNVGDQIQFDFDVPKHANQVWIAHDGSNTLISADGVDVFLVGYVGVIPENAILFV